MTSPAVDYGTDVDDTDDTDVDPYEAIRPDPSRHWLGRSV